MKTLISGAGVAGPAFAFWMGKLGHHVTVLERTHTVLPYGQNVDIQGSCRKVVEKMGLLAEIKRRNTSEKGTDIVDTNGKVLAGFPLSDGNGKVTASATSPFEILRGDMSLVLYEASKNMPTVNYRFSTTIRKVVSNTNESVTVELSNGQVEEYDMLVAADGQWSSVRKQCFAPEDLTVKDLGMRVAYFTIPRTVDDNDMWNIYIGTKSRIVTVRPDPYGTVRAMFSKMPITDAEKEEWLATGRMDKAAQKALLRREFSEAGYRSKQFLDAMDQTDDFYYHVIQQIKMPRWSNNRVICLGDTAFAPTPLTGMGTSLAILSGYLLAGEISKLKAGESVTVAYNEYDRVFRPFVEKTQQISSIFPGIVHPEAAWKRKLLTSGLWMISKIVKLPFLANKFDGGEEEDYKLPLYPEMDALSISG